MIPPSNTIVGGGAVGGGSDSTMDSRERGLSGVMRGWIPKGIQMEEEEEEEEGQGEDHEYHADIVSFGVGEIYFERCRNDLLFSTELNSDFECSFTIFSS